MPTLLPAVSVMLPWSPTPSLPSRWWKGGSPRLACLLPAEPLDVRAPPHQATAWPSSIRRGVSAQRWAPSFPRNWVTDKLTPRSGSCVATERSSSYVLNPAIRTIHNLPANPAEEHVYHVPLCNCTDFTPHLHLGMLLLWESTRCSTVLDLQSTDLHQLYEFRHSPCRAMSLFFVEIQQANNDVVVNGVVYFLMDIGLRIRVMIIICGVGACINRYFICSFNLGMEEWRDDIQGPISSSFVLGEESDFPEEYMSIGINSFAELKGYLVLPTTLDGALLPAPLAVLGPSLGEEEALVAPAVLREQLPRRRAEGVGVEDDAVEREGLTLEVPEKESGDELVVCRIELEPRREPITNPTTTRRHCSLDF
uniref:Uncharacterized protein n=1 Tax=Oryza punctata TaxID=4537 RepID=A0A0E0LJ84_ORYPU